MLRIADLTDPNSLASKLRMKRFALFESLLTQVPPPLTILDAGGTEWFWEHTGLLDRHDAKVFLLNLEPRNPQNSKVTSLVGDVRDMSQFEDRHFDVVFSNSVIEHVGDCSDQSQMAREVRRVGNRLFLQTPNRYFPIEPHFLFPFFQFLPIGLRATLLSHSRLGWMPRAGSRSEAIEVVKSIRLLTEAELTAMFGGARIEREMFCGMVKSYIVCEGW
jgi:hypothetical protein